MSDIRLEIKEDDIKHLHGAIHSILTPMVEYNEDPLIMANEAVKEMFESAKYAKTLVEAMLGVNKNVNR